jgi:hypothetical protein
MALMDLNKELSRQPAGITTADSLWNVGRNKEAYFISDEVTETAFTEMVLKLLNDPISEVKNLAVSWYVGITGRKGKC